MTNTKNETTKAREDRMMKLAAQRLREARKARLAELGWTDSDPRTRWI